MAIRKYNLSNGITLIESLFAIVIVSIIAGIVILLVAHPSQNKDTLNNQRQRDINTIAGALVKYKKNSKNKLPLSITTTPTEICRTDASVCKGYIDLSALTLAEKYLVSIPIDQASSTKSGTGYVIYKTSESAAIIMAKTSQDIKTSIE